MFVALALAVTLQAPAPLIGDVPPPVVIYSTQAVGDFQAPPAALPSKQQPQQVYPTAQGPPQVAYQAPAAYVAPCVNACQPPARRGLFGKACGHKAKKAARKASRAVVCVPVAAYSQTTYSRTTYQSAVTAPCSTCR